MILILTLLCVTLILLYLCHRGVSSGRPKEGAPDARLLDRRDFVKLTVAGGGAAAAAALAAWTWPGRSWDGTADVVVVGFGAAGAAAAIEASDQGARVMILEKMPIGGGTTLMSGGTIYASESPIQRELGVHDSAEEMGRLLRAAGKGLVRPDLVETASRQSGELVAWLRALGVDLWQAVFVGGAFGCELYPEYAAVTPPVRRVHLVRGMGEGLFRTLEARVAERGIPVLLESPAAALITEGGRVIGVRARSRWGDISVRARRGVVLGAGGFMYNRAMLSQFCRKGLRSLALGNPGDEGDGLRMGMEAGAALGGMADTVGLPAVRIPGQALGRPLLIHYYGYPGVLVDRRARRFVNEGIFYEFVNDALLGLEGDPPAWTVFDEEVRLEAQEGIVKYASEGLRKEIAEGLVLQADTPAGLAAALGLDPAALGKTLERYNAFAGGETEPDFGKTPETGLGPLDTPPFYAVGVHPGMIATTGGLRIDNEARVLDAAGGVIPGLYAAGKTAAGIVGVVFPASGANLLDALCFGRIAGRNAARGGRKG